MKYDSYRIMPLCEKCPFYFKVATDNDTTYIYLVRRDDDGVIDSMLLFCGEPRTRKQMRNFVYKWQAYINEQCWAIEGDDNAR